MSEGSDAAARSTATMPSVGVAMPSRKQGDASSRTVLRTPMHARSWRKCPGRTPELVQESAACHEHPRRHLETAHAAQALSA